MKKCSRIKCKKLTNNKSVCDDCIKSDTIARKENKRVLVRLFNNLIIYE